MICAMPTCSPSNHRLFRILTGVSICVVLTSGWIAAADDAPPQQTSAPVPAAAPAADANDVSDLPLHEVQKDGPATDKLGILISGDGGWWTLDNVVSETMAAHGVPIVGVSSHKYFATPRTPDSTAADMVRVLRHYLSAWKRERIVLMGYSLGAEIIPFVASRMPEDLKGRVAAVVMISPSKDTMFEFHLADWIKSPTDRATYPVQPEIEKLYAGPKLVCTTSDGDADCICGKLEASKVAVVARKGDHHYADDFTGLGEAIWDVLKDVK